MDTLAVEVRPVTCQYEMYSIQLFRTAQLSFICTLNKNSSVVLKEALLDMYPFTYFRVMGGKSF